MGCLLSILPLSMERTTEFRALCEQQSLTGKYHGKALYPKHYFNPQPDSFVAHARNLKTEIHGFSKILSSLSYPVDRIAFSKQGAKLSHCYLMLEILKNEANEVSGFSVAQGNSKVRNSIVEDLVEALSVESSKFKYLEQLLISSEHTLGSSLTSVFSMEPPNTALISKSFCSIRRRHGGKCGYKEVDAVSLRAYFLASKNEIVPGDRKVALNSVPYSGNMDDAKLTLATNFGKNKEIKQNAAQNDFIDSKNMGDILSHSGTAVPEFLDNEAAMLLARREEDMAAIVHSSTKLGQISAILDIFAAEVYEQAERSNQVISVLDETTRLVTDGTDNMKAAATNDSSINIWMMLFFTIAACIILFYDLIKSSKVSW